MNSVYQAMSKQSIQSKLRLQVHDELVLDVHHEEQELMYELVKNENALSFKVPM